MIVLTEVSKTVMSGTEPLTILHPLSVSFPKGQFVAIVGPSGSGKSTLLGLIAGLDAPTSGSVVIDDVNITTLGEDALARLRGEKMGFVFQFFHLIPSLTAYENVAVPMEIAGASDPGRPRAGPARRSRTERSRPSLSVAALRRRTAARRARAGAGQRSRQSSWPTSQPATSTAPTGATSWSCFSRSTATRGTTLILVTHDRELSALADVRLIMRDGHVVERQHLTASPEPAIP